MLTIDEVIDLHARLIATTGGGSGLRDRGALESAVAQPGMTFGGQGLYPTPIDKACALGYSLILNHPFVDGNKRIGQAAMETLLVMHGLEIVAPVDEQERVILTVAAGQMKRDPFALWLASHVQPLGTP